MNDFIKDLTDVLIPDYDNDCFYLSLADYNKLKEKYKVKENENRKVNSRR